MEMGILSNRLNVTRGGGVFDDYVRTTKAMHCNGDDNSKGGKLCLFVDIDHFHF